MEGNSTIPSSGRSSYQVRFRYQSHDINFADWISLITVCLAPLLAHLLAGVPQPVYLHQSRPKWHDMIVHYNPTSIIWRYFSIMDRRIRARKWNAMDMAAGNALFWTAHGWDGSEDMMIRSRAVCVRVPDSTRGRLLSADTIKTVIVALQGAQALFLLADSTKSSVAAPESLGTTIPTTYALDAIFMPIAVIGLLRLAAALWLTDEQLFVSTNNNSDSPNNSGSQTNLPIYPTTQRIDTDDSDITLLSRPSKPYLLPTTNSFTPPPPPANFHPSTSLRGLAPRLLYTSYILVCLLASLMLMMIPTNVPLPASTFTMGYLYAIILITTISTYTFYFVFRRSAPSTTILPCITTRWYKAYTCVVMLGMLALFVLSALETRRTPCGLYTTLENLYDRAACPDVVSRGT